MERKLTNEQVREIRTRAADGETQATLAEEYGIDQSMVSLLVHGRYYRDADGPIAFGDLREVPKAATKRQRRRIRAKMFEPPVTVEEQIAHARRRLDPGPLSNDEGRPIND